MVYPQSIPRYNKFRLTTPDALSGDMLHMLVECPTEYAPLLYGMMSLLSDVNMWSRESASGLTEQEAVDAYNNQVVILYDICAKIAECINTSSDVQKAIQDKASNGFGPQTIINNTQYSQNVLIAGAEGDSNGCGNDARFGRIVALVEYIDEVMADFFQSLDAATNIISQADELISAIPLFETLPVDELIGLVGDTGEFWRDSYDASLNTQLLEDFECQLWCEIGINCDVTIADVRAVIEARYNLNSTQGQLNALSATALIGRIAATIAAGGIGTYVGDDFVYLSWLLQVAAIEAAGTFFGVDPIDYNREASQGTANTGWSQCTCGQQTETWDFTQSDHSSVWTPRPSQAANMQYVPGTGWTNTVNGQVQLLTSRYSSIDEVTAVFSGATGTKVRDFGGAGTLSSLPYTGPTVSLSGQLQVSAFGTNAAQIESITVKFTP